MGARMGPRMGPHMGPIGAHRGHRGHRDHSTVGRYPMIIQNPDSEKVECSKIKRNGPID